MGATPVINMFGASDYGEAVRRAAGVLRDGGLAVLPTETVYGIAASASHPQAIARLKGLRGGDAGKPLTLHLARPDRATDLTGPLPPLSARMVRKLWPGPVALTFDVTDTQRQSAARRLEFRTDDVFEADGRLTLRCPSHVVAGDVLAEAGVPVVLSLAGGEADAARQVERFLPSVDGKVELVLDAGPTQYAKPSTIIHVRPDGYTIVRAGIYDERIIERLMRTTVLFVCSGNTCRSPMAEAIARKLLADRLAVPADHLEQQGYAVLSAGASAFPGGRATPEAVDAVRALGADLSRHRSRMLLPEMIHQADVVYTMETRHRNAVIALAPAAEGKVFPLDPQNEIEDPIGGDASLYREFAENFHRLIERRIDELLAPARSSAAG